MSWYSNICLFHPILQPNSLANKVSLRGLCASQLCFPHLLSTIVPQFQIRRKAVAQCSFISFKLNSWSTILFSATFRPELLMPLLQHEPRRPLYVLSFTRKKRRSLWVLPVQVGVGLNTSCDDGNAGIPFFFRIAGKRSRLWLSSLKSILLHELRTNNLGSLSSILWNQTLEESLPLFLILPLRKDFLLDLLIRDLTSQRIPDNYDHT